MVKSMLTSKIMMHHGTAKIEMNKPLIFLQFTYYLLIQIYKLSVDLSA